MKQKPKKKLKKSIIFKSFALLLMIISIVALFLFHQIGILPWKYFFLLFIILAFIDVGIFLLLKSKSWKKRMIGSIFTFLLLFLLGIGIFYQSVTLDFLTSAFGEKTKILNYQVLVLNNSNYHQLEDIKSGKIGVPKNDNSESVTKLRNELKRKSNLSYQEDDSSSLMDSLLNKNLKVIVMEEEQKKLLSEINDLVVNEVKVIETISIEVKNDVVKKNVAITKKPFNIFVSGSDSYGKINKVYRSDVNMVISVNPVTHQILLTSIPRDYYVKLHELGTIKDKMTHASIYGIDTSVKTVEDLLGIDINYYLKVNFSSLVKLVDAVGGVDVDSDIKFTAKYIDEPTNKLVTFSFQKGMNHLNGERALAFSRERKSFVDGDRKRAYHQQLVLKALISKASDASIFTKYPEVLKALNGNFETNLNYDDMMAFLQKQLEELSSWTVLNMVLEGSDSSQKTYSIPSLNSSVMIPKEESIKTAKETIDKIFSTEKQV